MVCLFVFGMSCTKGNKTAGSWQSKEDKSDTAHHMPEGISFEISEHRKASKVNGVWEEPSM